MGGGSSKKTASEPEEQRPTKTTHRQRLGDKPVPAATPKKEKKGDSNPVPLNYTVDVRIKCKYKSNVRVVHSSYVPTFRSLTKRLSSDYGFDVQLTYEDDDGDAITLSNQNDLDQLYDYCRRCELTKVDVFVTPAPSSDPHQALPGAIYEDSVTQSYHSNEPATPAARIRWRRGEILGEGAFGKVFLALHLDNGALMAVKQMTIKSGSDKEVASLMSEIDLMKALEHPHVVQYLGTEKHANTLSIFLEYVPGGSIASLLSKFGQFDITLVRTYTRQILLGLDHLHRHDIAHRDIKGANILIDNNGIVKLSDFGGSIDLGDVNEENGGMQSAKGTAYWMAPEVIRQKASKAEWKKADIWSVACTVVEMATGKPPWSNYSNPVTALYQIACRRAPPPMPEDMDELGTKFLQLCFKPQPDERSSTDELLLHHFVQSAHISSAALDATSNYEAQQQQQQQLAGAAAAGALSLSQDIDFSSSSLKESQASPAAVPSPTNRASRRRGRGGYSDDNDDDLNATGNGKSSSSSSSSSSRRPNSSWLRGRGGHHTQGNDDAGGAVNLRELVKAGKGGGANSSNEEEDSVSDQGYTTAEMQSDYDSERETDFSQITNAIDFDPMSLIDHNYSQDITNYGVATEDLQMSFHGSGGMTGIASSNFRLQIATRRKGRQRKKDILRAERRANRQQGPFGQGKDKQIRKLQNNMKKLQQDRLKNRTKEEAATKIQVLWRQYLAHNPSPVRRSFKATKRERERSARTYSGNEYGNEYISSPRGSGSGSGSGSGDRSRSGSSRTSSSSGNPLRQVYSGTIQVSTGGENTPDGSSSNSGIRPRGKVTTPRGMYSGGFRETDYLKRSGTAPHGSRPPTYGNDASSSTTKHGGMWDSDDDDEEEEEEGYGNGNHDGGRMQAERELQLERQKASARLRTQQMQAMEAGR